MALFDDRAARGPARVDRSGTGPATSAAVRMRGPVQRSWVRATAAGSVEEPPGRSDGVVGFVFQGGGSLTAPQVGMLWALTEAGIKPDLVVGSSAGALNALAFASDPSPDGLDELEAVWVSLRRRHVAPFSLRMLLAALTGRGDALVSQTALRVLLERAVLARTLRETAVPAHVVATDLASGQTVVLSEGATVPALLASSAFPGLYRSVEIGRRLLVDGGVSADAPVLQAEALGATVTYVLPAATWDVAQPLPHRPLPQAYHALRQILESAARRDVAAAHGPVHVLPAPTTRIVNPIDFRETAQLIDDGYRLATEWLTGHLAQASTPARADTSSPDLSVKRVVSAV